MTPQQIAEVRPRLAGFAAEMLGDLPRKDQRAAGELYARAAHYNGRRPRRSRELRPPRPDHPVADLSHERIKRRPVLGGLINEYERAA